MNIHISSGTGPWGSYAFYTVSQNKTNPSHYAVQSLYRNQIAQNYGKKISEIAQKTL